MDLPLCGVCGKGVPGDITLHYFATCDVCGTRCSIHARKSCLHKLWKETKLGKTDDVPDRTVPRDVFNDQKSVGLYCTHCRVPCFYCSNNTYHHGGKLFNYILNTYNTLHYFSN